MKTIGSYLKSARRRRKLSRGEVAEETRIKAQFIENIEKEKWGELPEFPVVVGFVKNIATFLDTDRAQALALLRRDYPPKQAAVEAPKKDLAREFRLGPRFVFFVGVLGVVTLVIGYLFFQYSSFRKPPELIVTAPEESETFTSSPIMVEGSTSPGANVIVNNQPVVVAEDGTFQTEVEVSPETREIVIKSSSRSGKEVEVRRTINVAING